MLQKLSTVMQLFKGPYFSVGAASRHLAWGTVQCTYFIIYEFCFTCFNVQYKRSYIFQSSSDETIVARHRTQ